MPDATVAALISRGWQCQSPAPSHLSGRCTHMFYRSFRDVRPECQTNMNGVQVCLHRHEWADVSPVSWCARLTAQCLDGEWVQFDVYGLSDETFIERLDGNMCKLIAAWKACNAGCSEKV